MLEFFIKVYIKLKKYDNGNSKIRLIYIQILWNASAPVFSVYF